MKCFILAYGSLFTFHISHFTVHKILICRSATNQYLHILRPIGKPYLVDREFDLTEQNAGGGEHFFRRGVHRRAVVFIREVNDLFDAGLDDRLRALVAGEQGHVDTAALQIRAPVIEDRVQLRMADVGVFRIGVVPRDGNARPGKNRREARYP